MTRTPLAVGAAFAAQGFGYAALVTALPSLRARTGLDDIGLSIVLLCIVVSAAVGSMLADVLAVRGGSRLALRVGLIAEACTLTGVAVGAGPAIIIPILILHGVGLGLVDAACNMQGSLAERAHGTPLFGRFFASSTMGGIIATVVTSAALTAGLMGQVPLVVAAAIYLAAGLIAVRWFDPERAARVINDSSRKRSPLPRGAIIAVGMIVFASFVIDASLATWATVYAEDDLQVAAHLAPLCLGLYLGAVFVTRLVLDPLLRRFGRRRIAVAAGTIGAIGCALMVLSQPVALALAGIALAGVASGALTPIAFGHAGEIMPERSDEVIARVNLFNYAAALVGAVIPGIVAEVAALSWAFLLPAVVAIACLPLMRILNDRVVATR